MRSLFQYPAPPAMIPGFVRRSPVLARWTALGGAAPLGRRRGRLDPQEDGVEPLDVPARHADPRDVAVDGVQPELSLDTAARRAWRVGVRVVLLHPPVDGLGPPLHFLRRHGGALPHG